MPRMSTSPAPPEDTAVVPLRERRRDWFFIVVFAIFASASFVTDSVQLVSRPDPHSNYVIARYVYNTYVATVDPILAASPRFLQVTGGGVSALLFGVCYLVLVYAFARGRDWIRLPAVFFAGMMVMALSVYLSVGLFGDAQLFRMACGATYSGFDYKFLNIPAGLSLNLVHPVVALLLVARMWRPHPFTRTGAAAPASGR